MNNTDPDKNGATTSVDFDHLQAACDGDAVVMRELMDLYFQQADLIMAGLERAINGNSVGDVNHLAHKLAGSSMACGVKSVVPPLRQMEGGAKAGHLDGARELFADVGAQMIVVRGRVQDYLLQYPSQKKN